MAEESRVRKQLNSTHSVTDIHSWLYGSDNNDTTVFTSRRREQRNQFTQQLGRQDAAAEGCGESGQGRRREHGKPGRRYTFASMNDDIQSDYVEASPGAARLQILTFILEKNKAMASGISGESKGRATMDLATQSTVPADANENPQQDAEDEDKEEEDDEQQDSDEGQSRGAGSRRAKRYPRRSVARLSEEFTKNPRPDPATQLQLSIELGLSLYQVKIWFQNKRARSIHVPAPKKAAPTPRNNHKVVFHHLFPLQRC